MGTGSVNPQITAFAAIAAALISLAGVFITLFINSSIAKKNIKLQKELAEKQIENEKKIEIRNRVSTYLSELMNINKDLSNFFLLRCEFEQAQNFLSTIIAEGGNSSMILGNNPKENVHRLEKELLNIRSSWNQSLKMIDQQAQELLLYFGSHHGNNGLDQLILSCPEKLKGINWIFSTNLPTENLKKIIKDPQIDKSINEIRKEMRDFLN